MGEGGCTLVMRLPGQQEAITTISSVNALTADLHHRKRTSCQDAYEGMAVSLSFTLSCVVHIKRNVDTKGRNVNISCISSILHTHTLTYHYSCSFYFENGNYISVSLCY